MSPNDLNRSVGSRIAARRVNVGKDQLTLSLDADVDRRTIQRVEVGEVAVRIDTLYQIVKALDTTMSELLEGLS